MILVGYEPPSKNYRLYDKDTPKVIFRYDVIFNENVIKVTPFHNEDEGETSNDESDFSPYLQHMYIQHTKTTMKIEESTINMSTTPTSSVSLDSTTDTTEKK
ncbi:unnamed protein product, partial [Ceratitis capitata]